MYLGIEIGGTKLQLALGAGDGTLSATWRGTVDPRHGGDGIRTQILHAIPAVCQQAQIETDALQGIGIGFGGPVDDATRTIIKSHQITGWDGFKIVDWLSGATGKPVIVGNDADLAGLAEARYGAGRGVASLLYITIGSGIGGGLILDGQIWRGTGRGAAEIGHLRVRDSASPTGELATLESIASGWGIGAFAQQLASANALDSQALRQLAGVIPINAHHVAQAARTGDALARQVLQRALYALADGLCAAIALICPSRIVIGGGVSLMGEQLIFEPLRRLVEERVFVPFAGLTSIVPAALGEEVVLHGAIALAQQHTS